MTFCLKVYPFPVSSQSSVASQRPTASRRPAAFQKSFALVTLALCGLLIGAATAVPEAHGQSGARSARLTGMAGGSSALGPPTEALYTNPAHLAVGPRVRPFELRLLDVRADAGGSLLQFSHYEDTFGKRAGTLSDKQEIAVLDNWFGGDQRAVTSHVSAVPAALTYRPAGKQWAVGVGLRARFVTTASTDRGLFDLFLVGADRDRTLPVNGRFRAYGMYDLTGTFSYAFESVPLSVGVSPRFIVGTGYADGDLSSSVEVRENQLTHRFQYTARAAGSLSREAYDTFDAFSADPFEDVSGGGGGPAGFGGGIDVGATYAVQQGLHVSVSLRDLGLIQWSSDPQTVSPTDSTFAYEGIELDTGRLKNEFGSDVAKYFESQVDSLARATYEDVSRDRSSFTTGLPTTLSASGTWAREGLVVNGGVTLGLNSRAGGMSASPAAHVGGTVFLGPVPIRTGVRIGGDAAVTVAGGVGLRTSRYSFNIGVTATPNSSTLGSGARYAVALSLATIRF